GNTSEGGDDIFFTKYNTDGNKLWTKQLGTTSDDWGRDMFIDSNNNAYITGFTGGALDGNVNAGGDDVFLMKVSAVPEPGTLAMLAVAAVMGLLYCWRKRG
ncbi:MAG: SBBP repeat-containing protein, partial [Planctomycetia bacterium]